MLMRFVDYDNAIFRQSGVALRKGEQRAYPRLAGFLIIEDA
jgi:hypothetical protein